MEPLTKIVSKNMIGLNMDRPSKSFLDPSSEERLATRFIASDADHLTTIAIRENILQPVANFSRYVGIMTVENRKTAIKTKL